MNPLLMVGAWAGAIIAIITVSRLAWGGFVSAVESVIQTSIGRVWKDMDDIESRLGRLETALSELREQVESLRDMLMAHVVEMTRRHD